MEEGTLEAAARSLYVTPSAISQRLKAMEDAAGQILLQRTSPVRPTTAGEAVLRFARQVRQLEWDALQELGGSGATPIAAHPAGGECRLPVHLVPAGAGKPSGGPRRLL